MKKILVITSHFPPSNLVGVHRARLLSMHLSSFGWEPIILTVDERYYEEKPDWSLCRLVSKNLRVEKVKAMKILRPRIVGDIGLRAFRSMYKKARKIVEEEGIDFVYITVPSFYGALWGRWLSKITGVSYGIDYRDPWVHAFPGDDKIFSRAWWATQAAKFLEPIAVKNVSIITGVSESYYRGVIKRNPKLIRRCLFLDLPIGIEPSDFSEIDRLSIKPYLFDEKNEKIKLVYAGAMLPKGYKVLNEFFKAIAFHREVFENIEFYFIGTGKSPDCTKSYNIRSVAEKYGLWKKQIFEHPAWIPYLDVLAHLKCADGVLVFGSTESHYTPSKIYQAVLAMKPVWAILHSDSAAVEVIKKLNAGVVLGFKGKEELREIGKNLCKSFENYRILVKDFDSEKVNWAYFEVFTAKKITEKLVGKLNQIIDKKDGSNKEKTKMRNNKPVKKILMITPHFPPSNLTAVHRPRLFSNHLKEFGWEPIILAVDKNYYEEKPDWDLYKLLPSDLRIERVKAMPLLRPRIVGDIGLRAFRSIFKKAKKIISSERIDFVYITIPSFYGALWGRMLFCSTGVRYGIDYVDPWVHDFPGSDRFLSRAWMATKVAFILEPIAVKNASLITGVAEKYYEGIKRRNPKLKEKTQFLTLPYGGEESDNEAATQRHIEPYLFSKKEGKIQLVYAGAMLPRGYNVLEEVFKAIENNQSHFTNVEFHFIGTGKTPNDAEGYNVRRLAEKYHLWQQQIFEHPARIPYLDVLAHIGDADGVFVPGSTDLHYTPSKIYQAVLAKKPIFAILHAGSTAVEIIENTNAGIVLSFEGENDLTKISSDFKERYQEYLKFVFSYDSSKADWSYFNDYSARELTKKLAWKIDEVIGEKGNSRMMNQSK